MRKGDFDLNDRPENEVLQPFGRLKDALGYIEEVVLPVWKTADKQAMRFQSRHRKLAKVAIFTGTSAIFFAIIQMAVARQIPSLVNVALALEVVAVIAGIVAVAVGIRSKGDKNWLRERNRAERLRMLKFQSLGWGGLFDDDLGNWKQKISEQMETLKAPLSIDEVKAWALKYKTISGIQIPFSDKPYTETNALSVYYLYKRLMYQAGYFEKQAKKHEKAARPWRHLSLPVFIASTICVLIHFISGWFLLQFNESGMEHLRNLLEAIEIWSLALATIIPVLGLSTRVWLGAFEPHRSANLYHCKRNAVLEIRERMMQQETDPHLLNKNIDEAETLFENEHREWLRLMFETEWML